MKKVLITGANGGIGRALIEAFVNEGYKIYANVRTVREDFIKFAENLSDKCGADISIEQFDITNEKAIKECVQNMKKSNVSIDVLVNNAGVAHGGLLQMTHIDKVKEVFETNFFGTFLMCQYFSRNMQKNGGVIINISSVAGLDLEAGNSAYGSSKAAVIALTKTISRELALYNIRVNAVAPGLTDTKMAGMMEKRAGEEMVERTAFGRLAKAKEIADTVVFLASEKASFITGQVIRVDGGMM